MKHQHKFSRQQQQEQLSGQQSEQQAAREFASAEELLRFDASRTEVPESVARRLQESAEQIPAPPARPWWKNLFRK